MHNKVAEISMGNRGVTASRALPLRNMTVLLVEDEAILAIDITEELRRFGAAVIGPARTVREALKLVQDSDLTAAVLDLNLMGELSFPVAELLFQRNVPFIFQTGYFDSPMISEKWPNTKVLIKPLNFALLIDTVGSLSKVQH